MKGISADRLYRIWYLDLFEYWVSWLCAIESAAPNALQLGTLCKGDRCKKFATAESEGANAGYCGRDEYAGNIGDLTGWDERIFSNGRDLITLAAACNGVRNIDDAILGAVVVAGNRGGVIRIEGVRQALVVFVVRKGAGSSMADACAAATLRQRGDGQQGEEQGHRKDSAQKP